MIKENVYGHRKRLDWIRSRVAGAAVEIGCGTGYMITLPLARENVDVVGYDPDGPSVTHGRTLFRDAGVDPDRIRKGHFPDDGTLYDAVIVSEVLEHIPQSATAEFFDRLRRLLQPGGVLLVTVPNGYGWFELESFLWFRAGIGKLLGMARVETVWNKVKDLLPWTELEDMIPSTCAGSPHCRRFTLRSLSALLRSEGFEVFEASGSVLFAGPLSQLLWGGIRPLMWINGRLGGSFPRLASGFFVSCRLQGFQTTGGDEKRREAKGGPL